MRILLIDDDYNYSNAFLGEVEKQYVVDTAYSAEDGVFMSEVTDYDAIVVNVSPNSENFHDVCKCARGANVKSPILVLADSANTDLRIKVLDDGADACLYKPVGSRHITAQINALVRRSAGVCLCNKISCGNLHIDQNNKIILYGNVEIILRKKEFDLIEYLAVNFNKVVLKETLLEHVWGDGMCINSNSLEVHVRAIRKKFLDIVGVNPIKTLKGVGYKLQV